MEIFAGGGEPSLTGRAAELLLVGGAVELTLDEKAAKS